MSYIIRPNASGDTLNSSKLPIRTNFQLIQSRFDENHVDIDGGSGGGKHKFLQMPDQGSAPTTAANEGGVYVKNASGSNLFFRSESDGEEYQLTTVADAEIATFGTNTGYVANHTGGWSFLPGGLIMQYGIRTSLSQGNNTITFPYVFPAAVFSIQVTAVRSGTNNIDTIYLTGTIATDTFQIRNTASGITSCHWYAIGN